MRVRRCLQATLLDWAHWMATQDPEAFGRLVVEILRKVADLDRDVYECLWGGMISGELQAAGLLVALEQAKQALSSGDIDRVRERVGAIEGWVRTIEYLGSRDRLAILAGERGESPTEGVRSPNAYVM